MFKIGMFKVGTHAKPAKPETRNFFLGFVLIGSFRN